MLGRCRRGTGADVCPRRDLPPRPRGEGAFVERRSRAGDEREAVDRFLVTAGILTGKNSTDGNEGLALKKTGNEINGGTDTDDK